MKDIIKCYISGQNFTHQNNEGIVSFAVPEYGVLFRCTATGSKTELEVIGFLSFLRFVEHNIDIFKKKRLLIYSDFPLLAYALGQDPTPVPGMEAVVNEAIRYRTKIEYIVKWINPKENRAANSVINIPEMPQNSGIKIKTFANLSITRPNINGSDYHDISGDLKI